MLPILCHLAKYVIRYRQYAESYRFINQLNLLRCASGNRIHPPAILRRPNRSERLPRDVQRRGSRTRTRARLESGAIRPHERWFCVRLESGISFPAFSGVVFFNKTNGIWLVHSVPKFPDATRYTYPDSGTIYGQSMLCMTFSYSKLSNIGKFSFIDKYIVLFIISTFLLRASFDLFIYYAYAYIHV